MGKSPVKKKKAKLMSFPDALVEVIAGKKINSLAWGTKDSYGVLKDGFLVLFLNNKFHRWMVSDGDLLAKDFIVLEETSYN